MHSALVYYRNCHCKTLFKISQHGGTARCAGVFKTCSCGDDRGGRNLNPDHGILGKQGSDRSYRDEVESGTDFCSLHDITSKSENESNMGDDSGRSDESGNITHLKVDEREKYAGKNKKCGKSKRGTKNGGKKKKKKCDHGRCYLETVVDILFSNHAGNIDPAIIYNGRYDHSGTFCGKSGTCQCRRTGSSIIDDRGYIL